MSAAVVGYESSSNRVARYSFKAPATGASGISLSGSGVSLGGGSSSAAIRYYITTSSTSHANAGSGWVQAMPYIDTGSEWKLSLMGKNTMWMCILFASRLFSKKSRQDNNDAFQYTEANIFGKTCCK